MMMCALCDAGGIGIDIDIGNGNAYSKNYAFRAIQFTPDAQLHTAHVKC